jgi:hypothetical protein
MTILLVVVVAAVLLGGRSNQTAVPTASPTPAANPGQEVLGAVLGGLQAGAEWLHDQVAAANEANSQPAPAGSVFDSLNNIFGRANANASPWAPVNTAANTSEERGAINTYYGARSG